MNLYERHVPKDVDDIFGQREVVDQFRDIRKKVMKGESVSQCYVFSGQYGIGKSAMAKLLAEMLGCDIRWYNSAHTNGVDFSRNFAANTLPYSRGFSGRGTAYIIEEAHRMTKAAQENLLVPLEKEIPPGSAVIFTTTEPNEIRGIINSGRARHFELKPLKPDDLLGLLNKVDAQEGFGTDDEILQRIAHGSNGSARLALQNLEYVAAMSKEDQKNWRPSFTDDERTPNSESLRDALSGVSKMSQETAWKQISEVLRKIKADGDEVDGVRRYLAGTYAGKLTSPNCKATRAEDFFGLQIFEDNTYYDSGYPSLVKDCFEYNAGVKRSV